MSETRDGIIETGDPDYRLCVTDSPWREGLPTVTLQFYSPGDGWHRRVSTLVLPGDSCPAAALRRHLQRLDDIIASAQAVPA
ncbi:MAG: hypothetical protein RLO11_00140 [Salinisphaeraceae bacterium]